MLKEERQQKILERLYASGKVQVVPLAREFESSQDTIRRDLTDLEDQGFLKRVYGGAVPFRKVVPGFDGRTDKEKNEKYIVAKKAVELVRPGSLIAIDGGTTNTLFASLLPMSSRLRVVTNSFLVAEELRKRPDVDVTFLGGSYDKQSQVTVGEAACLQLDSYLFDQCFLGAYGVDAATGLTIPEPFQGEVGVKRRLIDRSREVNVMGVCSKLGVSAEYVICPIDRIDRIICERPVPKLIQKKYGGRIV